MSNETFPQISYFTFLSTHSEFITLDNLMKLPISLLCLSKKKRQAYFVDFINHTDPYRVRKHSILFRCQRKLAKHLYTLPLDLFYEYVSTLDVVNRRIVWLQHTARCGSTLWAQVFGELPGWSVVSECQYIIHSLLNEHEGDNIIAFSKSAEFKRMAVAGFKFNMSRFPPDHSVFVKGATLQDMSLLQPIRGSFPNLKILLSYRNLLPSAYSHCNALTVHRLNAQAISAQMERRRTLDDYYQRFWVYCHCQPWIYSKSLDTIDLVLPKNQFEWYLVMRCSITHSIRAAQDRGIDIKCIKYDHMLKNPRETITAVFDYIGIDRCLVECALRSASQDSQKGMSFSQDNSVKRKPWVVSAESMKRCLKIVQFFGHSELEFDMEMPSTL